MVRALNLYLFVYFERTFWIITFLGIVRVIDCGCLVCVYHYHKETTYPMDTIQLLAPLDHYQP